MPERRKLSVRLRRYVMNRARYRCEYCRAPESYSLDTFAVDHIQPLAAGGCDNADNLAFACNNCNNRKQDAITAPDPETGERVALYNPRIDCWSDHFAWSMDALTLVPLSATGRATILRLQLNRQGVINIRRALIALGEEHPPYDHI